MKKRVRGIAKFIARQRYLLVFLNGVMLATAFFLFVMYQYENELYKNLSDQIKYEARARRLSPQQEVVFAMNTTHYLQQNRKEVFTSGAFNSIKAKIFCSADVHLMSALGACGSFSMVLGRVLNEMGYVVRIGQMKVKGLYGGHIILEVLVNGKWITLDPLFNTHFEMPDGHFASFQEVSRNWKYFEPGLPASYNRDYAYEGIRFANWGKIPVVSPAVYYTLRFLKGKEWVDNFSLRPYFLNLYRAYLTILVILYIPVLVLTWFSFVLKRPYVVKVPKVPMRASEEDDSALGSLPATLAPNS